MTPLFNIRPTQVDFSNARLFIEIGEYGLSYFVLDETNTFSLVCIHQFADKLQAESSIRNILYGDTIFKEKFRKIDILYSFSESVLVPKELSNAAANKEMLELVYGDFSDKVIRGDFMYKHTIQNVYRIPNSIDLLVNNLFAAANYTHLYSLLPDLAKSDRNELYTIFSPNHIIVMLSKKGRLQVIQNFTYQTPEDAAYHLLNVCESFDAERDQTSVVLTGMVDASSPLYAELYKYFLQIEFNVLSDQFQYSDEVKTYPEHFFSHLFAIATCV